jgi:SAM-dependent methyltransferase
MGDMQRWQLTGSAPEIYADYLVPAIFRPWAPVVLDSVQLQAGQSVLDVACGTGIVATGAAERVGAAGSVVGVDINPGMLALAAGRSGNKAGRSGNKACQTYGAWGHLLRAGPPSQQPIHGRFSPAKNVRTSSTRSPGVSSAAKWPPSSKSDQCTILLLCWA